VNLIDTLHPPTVAPQATAPAGVSFSRGAPSVLAPARARGPRIGALALAHAPDTLSQEQVLDRLGLRGEEFAERIFARCGVQRRHLSLSPELLATTLQGRTQLLEDELFGHAVAAVDALRLDPARIGTVLTGTLYSLGGPTLAHRLVDHYAMDPATDKYHVLGVGCASAVPLLRLATQSLPGHPGRHTLVVAAESMSGLLTRSRPGDTRAKVIGSAIFGDGCAAAVLEDGAGEPGEGGGPLGEGAGRHGECRASGAAAGPTIVASKVHQIGGTLGAVRMALAADDSYLHLDRDLPDKAVAGLAPLVEDFLAGAGASRAEIDHWIVHPGGRRIVESARDALALRDEQVAVSWDVLANYGNVGTPSIFYVLAKLIERRAPQPGERGLMVTIGPGITVGLMLLQW
jgi:predicted naringenin-chalcone synthase